MFKRRDGLSAWAKIREAMWPRAGWRRSFQYIGRRVQRMQDTPHRVAIGFSCGVFASFTPFFGFHFVIAASLAYLARGNIIAGLLGTSLGNPITFPLIVASSMGVGNMLLGRPVGGVGLGDLVERFRALIFAILDRLAGYVGAQGAFGAAPELRESAYAFWRDLFLPYLVGGIGPGLFCAIAAYLALRPIVGFFQDRRRKRISERAREIVKAHMRAREAQGGGGRGRGLRARESAIRGEKA